jgi:cell division septum initiation protein DivIVA
MDTYSLRLIDVSDISDCDIENKISELKLNISSELHEFNIDRLKDKCKDIGISGLSKLKKPELVSILEKEFLKLISNVKEKKVNELKNIGKQCGIKRVFDLKKDELIYQILHHHSSNMLFRLVENETEHEPKIKHIPFRIDVDVKKKPEDCLRDKHQHILIYMDSPNYFCMCDICDEQILSPHFHCKCNYDVCDKCVKSTPYGERMKEEKKKEEERMKEEKKKEEERMKEEKKKEEDRMKEEKKKEEERMKEEKKKEEDRMKEEKKKEEDRLKEEKKKEEDRLKEEKKKEEDRLKEEKKKEEDRLKEENTKKKKQSIPKNVRIIVWNHYIGEDIIKHKCLCCKKVTISNTNFEVGHVQSEKNGGTHEINNLRPICFSCNHSMATENMIDFVVKYGLYIG